MRYLYLLLFLGLFSCQAPDSPYFQAQSSPPWMAFQVNPSDKAQVEEMMRYASKPSVAKLFEDSTENLSEEQQKIIDEITASETTTFEEWLEFKRWKLFELWQNNYGNGFQNSDFQWTYNEGRLILLLRLPPHSREQRVPNARKHPEYLEPFSGVLEYHPEDSMATSEENRSFHTKLKLHFQQGHFLGPQYFFYKNDSLHYKAHFALKETQPSFGDSSDMSRHQSNLVRTGTWLFYEKTGEVSQTIDFENDTLEDVTWSNGQTGKESLAYLKQINQIAWIATGLIIWLLIFAYFFRKKHNWGKKLDRPLTRLLSWLLVLFLLTTLVKQVLPDWQIFFHTDASSANPLLALFIFSQIIFFAVIVGIRKPQWTLVCLNGLLFFINLGCAMYFAQIELSILLSAAF